MYYLIGLPLLVLGFIWGYRASYRWAVGEYRQAEIEAKKRRSPYRTIPEGWEPEPCNPTGPARALFVLVGLLIGCVAWLCWPVVYPVLIIIIFLKVTQLHSRLFKYLEK